jgi:hypothetical protein
MSRGTALLLIVATRLWQTNRLVQALTEERRVMRVWESTKP